MGDRYVSRSKGCIVDPAFFELIGVVYEDHRQRFTKWFAERPAYRRNAGVWDERGGCMGLSCREWLRTVAVEGETVWKSYSKSLASIFDCVGDIEERYVRSGKGVRELDPAFFDVICISDPDHRHSFQEWFKRNKCLPDAAADANDNVSHSEKCFKNPILPTPPLLQAPFVEPEQEPGRRC